MSWVTQMGRQFADGNENHVIAKQALSFKMFEILSQS